MNTSTLAVRPAIAFLLSACLLAGCGGTKVLKESQPIQTTKPLAVASDPQVSATLDWVIVRDGPGTWAKNADWDEYLLTVNNQTNQPVQLTRLLVIDSLDTRVESQTGRKQLVKGSKTTAKRYKKSGMRVRAGRGAGILMASGAAVTVAGYGVAAASIGLGGVSN